MIGESSRELQIFVIPPLLTIITLEGFTGEKSESIRSELRALANHTPSLERLGHGVWV